MHCGLAVGRALQNGVTLEKYAAVCISIMLYAMD